MNRGALHLTMMGRECSWLDPSYQRHITCACTGCYQLHPHHRLGIITPGLLPTTAYNPYRAPCGTASISPETYLPGTVRNCEQKYAEYLPDVQLAAEWLRAAYRCRADRNSYAIATCLRLCVWPLFISCLFTAAAYHVNISHR